ncbi:hypothetical protein [Mesorhizobium sp. 131-2-1]|uniref:hypothetical protein n=1 Tax=Mesorhizobium sp. 131-2-1 TaxID=2744518 RepID=UPI001925C1B0|nr:hypothetical protein [Mesorhizobium sp. 131-2-1]
MIDEAKEQGQPFRACTITDEKGRLGILSIQTTQGLLESHWIGKPPMPEIVEGITISALISHFHAAQN